MPSSRRLFMTSHCNPPDQFMIYGSRMFGSIQEAFRLEKFVPTNGALPSAATVKGTGPGPWDNRNAGRGSPTGTCTAADARYSSKFWPELIMNKSWLMRPKLPRKTSFGRKFHATPRRGSKLSQWLLETRPGRWTMAPSRPVIGSFTVGSNWDCCPYLV